MFDLINGLPVHPLVVHAVVVLLPLATLGTLAIAVRPAWRRAYGPLVVACAAVATVLIPVATSSGEALENLVARLPPALLARLRGQTVVVSSARLAGLARENGFEAIVQARSAAPADLLATAASALARHRL